MEMQKKKGNRCQVTWQFLIYVAICETKQTFLMMLLIKSYKFLPYRLFQLTESSFIDTHKLFIHVNRGWEKKSDCEEGKIEG